MKTNSRFGAAAVCLSFFIISGHALYAQEQTAAKHVGLAQDWSYNHIVYSRDTLAQNPGAMRREPRVAMRETQRSNALQRAALRDVGTQTSRQQTSGPKRDWSYAALGGHLRYDMFPAKYTFDPAAPPDCTNDYVVFALGVIGSSTQANIVGFNNLYSGPGPGNGGLCNLPGPTVLFAYNITTVTGGKILTSPILSLDGKQIAFVETVSGSSGSSIFHVLTWAPGGTITAPATPATMTSVLLLGAASDSISSPWLDYGNDIVYVGADNGEVYKITSALTASPVLSGSPWPVTVSTAYRLTSPVLDGVRDLLMVGSNNGTLYQITTANGAVASIPIGSFGTTSSGIITPPVLDVTNGSTFVVDGDSSGAAILEEVNTFALTQLSVAVIGEGGSTGTKVHLLHPAFSSAYFTQASTGTVNVCGTGALDTTPWQYTFAFTATRINSTPVFSQQLSSTGGCAGWTEFFNPNVGPNETITATSVAANILTVTANYSDLLVGAEVYLQNTGESFLNGQTVVVKTLIGPGPVHTGFTATFTNADYTNSSDTGTAGGTDFFFFGLTLDCTLIGGTSTTGCVVAEANSGGTTTTSTAYVDGGPSGIVVDNYSTASEASSIYLTSVLSNVAYKYTQESLQ